MQGLGSRATKASLVRIHRASPVSECAKIADEGRCDLWGGCEGRSCKVGPRSLWIPGGGRVARVFRILQLELGSRAGTFPAQLLGRTHRLEQSDNSLRYQCSSRAKAARPHFRIGSTATKGCLSLDATFIATELWSSHPAR